MRTDRQLTRLRRAQRPLAAVLLALFLLQLPLTALLTGGHVAEMALAALYGDSICRPGQTDGEPDQPKAPPGHSDCCLTSCFNPFGSTADLPSAAVTVRAPQLPAAGTSPVRREAHTAPARFASDISSRGPPSTAA